MPTRILHQSWLDPVICNNTCTPAKYLRHCQSLKDANPNWEYRLWNSDKVRHLLDTSSPYREFWEGLVHIEKCDFARYLILYCFGGLYIDLDFAGRRCLDDLVRDEGWVMWHEPPEHVDAQVKHLIDRNVYNGVMYSTPKQGIWLQIMRFVVENYKAGAGAHRNTGPVMLALFMKQHPEHFRRVRNNCEVMPLRGDGQVSMGCPSDALEQSYVYTKWCEGTGVFGGGPLVTL